MIDESSGRATPDAIAVQLGLIQSASVDVRERAARDLLVAVHRAVFAMCVKLLGDAEDAHEAEAETIARLVARASDRAAVPIANGTAYARQIARHVCNDLHRQSRYRHDRSVDDLDEGRVPSIADHGSTMYTPRAVSPPPDRTVVATFGYTSKRALADLECLTRQELNTVILRQEGYSYAKIAGMIGAGVTTGAAEKQGERGLHKLRGIVHVGVWRQEAVAAWTDPSCPVLAELQGLVKQQLHDGKKITSSLYVQIGRHLDPDPNRRPGEQRAPRCAQCVAERERSRREYWWLLIMLMPCPVSAPKPSVRPVALVTELVTTMPSAAHRPGRRRAGRALSTTVAVALLALIAGILVAVRLGAGQHATAQAAPAEATTPAGATTPARANDPSRRGESAPSPAHTTRGSEPSSPTTPRSARPNDGGPTGGEEETTGGEETTSGGEETTTVDELPATHQMIFRLACCAGTISATIDGVEQDTCTATNDNDEWVLGQQAPTCTYTTTDGQRVTLTPGGSALDIPSRTVQWPVGLCHGQSGNEPCTFIADGDLDVEFYVLDSFIHWPPDA